MGDSGLTDRIALRLYATSVLSGIANTMLGPAMPWLQTRWHIGDGEAGLLFGAMFLSSVLTAAAVGFLAARYGHLRVIACGMLLVSAGVAATALGGWPLVLLAVALYGCGLGLAIPAGNFAAAALHPGSSAGPVMLLNLAWCCGAVSAPALIALAPNRFLWMVTALALGAAAMMWRQPPIPVKASIDQRPSAFSALTWMAAAILFLYVGSEATIAGWVASLAARSFRATTLWAILPSVFWMAMLAGRALAPRFLRSARPEVLAPAGLGCAFAAATLLLSADGAALVLAAGALCGFALAPVFPLTVSQYADRQPDSGGSGVLFSAAGLGGAAIPSLVGFLSQSSGSLRLGMSTVLAALGAALFFQILLGRSARPLQ